MSKNFPDTETLMFRSKKHNNSQTEYKHVHTQAHLNVSAGYPRQKVNIKSRQKVKNTR